jgi:threonine aldolase
MIDLRSDTVTHPTPAMRQAMFEAEVGDDQYGEDPTVNRLEARAAEVLGKEAAVFVTSGTMGNLSSVLAHCGRGDEAIVGDESHILWFESGGVSTLGGVPVFALRTDRFGQLDPGAVADAIRPARPGYPRTGVVCLESSHNRCGGVVLSLEYMREVKDIAHERGVPIHLDGARIFNAAATLGVPASAIAAEADSVQFCLSKGLAAPVGSMVAGTAEFIGEVRRQRKVLGGAMRQAGVIAAAGLVALVSMIDRLPEDHTRARILADGLAEVDGITIDRDTVQSNIVVFRVDGVRDHTEFIARLRERGVMISNYGLRGARMVTHYQIDNDAIETALSAIDDVMSETRERIRVHA